MQNNANFKFIARKTLELLSSKLEEILEDTAEIEETEDILKILLADMTILLNLHAPSNQIWLSSPLSGALHFFWDETQAKWISTRSSSEDLFSCLEKDLSHFCKFPVLLK
ncbi:MAG: iron donor protein CyaY [Caedibacter sp. 37-49]|nr:MAG: iron donor protein CyaY [Caedibacter sp. 37-49]